MQKKFTARSVARLLSHLTVSDLVGDTTEQRFLRTGPRIWIMERPFHSRAVDRRDDPLWMARGRTQTRIWAVSEDSFLAALYAAQIGDSKARDRLFTFLYAELRRMAQRELRRGTSVALSPTTLLHETFLNISQRDSVKFSTRGEFMSYASRAMRGLIVDHLRARHAEKRGGQLEITSLSTWLYREPIGSESIEMEKLSDALESLEKTDPRLAECVDLKFFCGFSFAEIAQLRDVSERTVQRDWDKARLLLNRFFRDQEDEWQAAS